MRATRDLLRRRIPLVRQRAALLTHSQQPHRPYTLPERGKTRAYQANRDGVAERFAEPAGQKSLAVDLARSRSDAHLLNDVELTMVNTAQHHAPHTFSRRPAVPGIGTILRLVMLSTIHAIARFPRGQDCVSSGRVVTWAKASAGQRSGTSGTKIGNASVTWACSEAAVLCLRDHPAGQTSLGDWRKNLARARPSRSSPSTWPGQSLTW